MKIPVPLLGREDSGMDGDGQERNVFGKAVSRCGRESRADFCD
jgi:hypothetical protein